MTAVLVVAVMSLVPPAMLLGGVWLYLWLSD